MSTIISLHFLLFVFFSLIKNFEAFKIIPQYYAKKRSCLSSTTITGTSTSTSTLFAINTFNPTEVMLELKENINSDLRSHLSFTSPMVMIQKFVMAIPQLLKIFEHLHWISILDFSIILIFLKSYKPFLQKLFSITRDKTKLNVVYETSLIGVLEKPIMYTMYYLPFLYILDFFSICAHYLGLSFLIRGDIPRMLRTCAKCFIGGSWATTVKDWFVQQAIRGDKSRERASNRDIAREDTIDELTSIAIWFVFCGIALEALRLEFGYALGSIFALGGIGSASVIFALKETMENLLGGILLKLNDKFRVGDNITIGGKGKEQGKVFEISYLSTSLLLEDNSSITIPNKVFTVGEVINWSRTEYRLFKTSAILPISKLKSLPMVVNSIRNGLEAIPQVEKVNRSVKVAASGFDDNNIVIDINLHFKARKGLDNLKTEAVNIISTCIKESLID